MTGEARERSFDELARGLADGSLTRGKALRLMGAALLGSVLFSIPGVAWAKPKPGTCTKNKHCPAGQTCVDRQCQAAEACIPGTGGCSADGEGVCVATFDGGTTCVCSFNCSGVTSCADCAPTEICHANYTDPTSVCCGTPC
jgi:hypothetical protein